MRRKRKTHELFDVELNDLPPELRWREWMGRAEAVIFASPRPVSRETLAKVVGRDCNLEHLLDDIRHELRDRPYELVAVASGWQHRSRKNYADAIRAAAGLQNDDVALSKQEWLVLTAVAYFQPITRQELSAIYGREISRDLIADLRAFKLIAAGPRSPRPGAPYNYVTTNAFLERFGFETLRDLPDMQRLEEAGMLSKHSVLSGDLESHFGIDGAGTVGLVADDEEGY